MKRILVSLAALVLLPLTVIAQIGDPRPVFKNGYWGYADAAGRMVIEPRFDAAAPFEGGLARVGMVNEEKPEFDGSPNLSWGYIDERGAVIVPLRYVSVRPFADGLAAVAERVSETKLPPFRTRVDLRWGYVNRKGEVVVPLQFLAAADFAEGLAAVNVLPTEKAALESNNCDGPRNFGYIDAAGAFVVPPMYTIAGQFVNGRAHVALGGFAYVGRCLCCAPRFRGSYGQIDRTGTFTEIGTSEGMLVDGMTD